MAQINKPSDYFNTVLYTGDGAASKSITGVGFEPNFVWIKGRSGADNHNLFDNVRGVQKVLRSNLTDAEVTYSNSLLSFDTDGFTVGTHTPVNRSGGTIASWNWLAGGTASSNTDGSITSSVSANTTSGFSIVSYTGTGANATVGHGLGVAPKFMIFKNRSGVFNWNTYHSAYSPAQSQEFNTTNLAENTGSAMWNSTATTSSVFSIGTSGSVNQSSASIIAYCFAEKKGYSKFGSYTGNGNADGTFIYTGFKPAMIITKQTNASGGQWYIYDSVRNEFNLTDKQLFPNLSNAESTGNNQYDFYSNGFKARSSNGDTNASGGTYIYMAFAEQPLVGTNNIPATAR